MSKKLSIIVAVLVILSAVGLLIWSILSGDASGNDGLQNAPVDPSDASEDVSDTQKDDEPYKLELTETAKVFITASGYLNEYEYSNCSIQVFSKAGDTTPAISDKNCQIKIRGNSTSQGEKKPFNIKFSQKTDVLGMGANTRWSLLANCFDKSLIRNQTVYDFASAIGLDYTPSYKVTEVYLNNRFLGCYLLCDPIDVSEDRIDIDNEGTECVFEYVIPTRTDRGVTYITTSSYNLRFAIREPEVPNGSQRNWLKNHLNKAETALASGNYDEVKKYFDTDSMVDFYIVNELFKNVDIAIGSTFFYIKDDKIHGGPVWDFDLSSGNCSYDYFNYYEYNNINGEGNGSGNNWEGIYCDKLWFKQLLSYKEFYSAVVDRYVELQDVIVNLYEKNSLGDSYIDIITTLYASPFQRNYNEAGWSLEYPYCEYERQYPESTYRENVEFFRGWLKKRNQWLIKEWNIS